jgi:hypothetical protein
MLQQMVRRAVAFIAVLGTFGGCMSPPGHLKPDPKAAKPAPPNRVEEQRTPPAPSKAPVEKAPVEKAPASLGDMVADVALITGGELICSDGMQCNGAASWSNCDFGSPKVATNDKVRVITEVGVADMTLVIGDDSVSVAPVSNANEQADEIELGLVLRNARPSATARLEARRLDAKKVSAAEAKGVREWLEKTFPDSLGPTVLEPIGAVVGTFGNGVDRIVVFAPNRRLTDAQLVEEFDSDGPFDHDVAVLLAGNEPRAILPFDEVTGLEVVHAVDLDGDGTQELVWVSQAASGTLFTVITISYFNGSEFAIVEVAGCTYTGCDGFVAPDKCGHSLVKWRDRGRGPG